MAEAFVTLAEAAELEGVKYKTMAQWQWSKEIIDSLKCWSAGEFAVFKNGQKIETVNEAMKMKGVGQ